MNKKIIILFSVFFTFSFILLFLLFFIKYELYEEIFLLKLNNANSLYIKNESYNKLDNKNKLKIKSEKNIFYVNVDESMWEYNEGYWKIDINENLNINDLNLKLFIKYQKIYSNLLIK